MSGWKRWVAMWLGVSVLAAALLITLDTVLLYTLDIPNEPAGGLLRMLGANLVWFMKAFAAFVAIALLVAFLVGESISKLLPVSLRTVVMSVAGLCAIPVLFWAMKQVFFGVDILAGARDAKGYVVQALLSGGLMGALFGGLTRRRRRSRYAVE